MDLHTGSPYWLLLDGLRTVVPALDRDRGCDVAVIGAGITGALVAHALVEAGLSVVVLDGRDLGQGSTMASTALLQYDLDVPLHRLEAQIGEEKARSAFRAGVSAIDRLVEIGCAVGCAVERVPSVYAVFEDRRVGALREEFERRSAAGLEVEWMSARDAKRRWGVRLRAGILSAQGAQVDPYLLTHNLLRRASEWGAVVADRTMVRGVRADGAGFTVATDREASVHAGAVVYATGYEASRHLPAGAVELASTFVFASEPMEAPAAPCMLWELADPYIYLRWVGDRLLVGGADEPTSDEHERDGLVERKARELQRRVRAILPDRRPEIGFAWAGTFASTPDGLGYIGGLPGRDREMVALGFGGNGITMSALASEILRDAVLGVRHELGPLFDVSRATGGGRSSRSARGELEVA